MRLLWKSLDKMRCLRKRSAIPFLGFLITFLLFLNLYIEDGYVLVCTAFLLPVSLSIPRCHDNTGPSDALGRTPGRRSRSFTLPSSALLEALVSEEEAPQQGLG